MVICTLLNGYDYLWKNCKWPRYFGYKRKVGRAFFLISNDCESFVWIHFNSVLSVKFHAKLKKIAGWSILSEKLHQKLSNVSFWKINCWDFYQADSIHTLDYVTLKNINLTTFLSQKVFLFCDTKYILQPWMNVMFVVCITYNDNKDDADFTSLQGFVFNIQVYSILDLLWFFKEINYFVEKLD